MKAELFILKNKRGCMVILDNGYGREISLTDYITLEEAQKFVLEFKNSISKDNVKSI